VQWGKNLKSRSDASIAHRKRGKKGSWSSRIGLRRRGQAIAGRGGKKEELKTEKRRKRKEGKEKLKEKKEIDENNGKQRLKGIIHRGLSGDKQFPGQKKKARPLMRN